MHTIERRHEAVRLRKQGYSYGCISERLGISKGTLYPWLASIPYTPNKEVVARIGKARAKSGERKSALKRESLKEAKRISLRDIASISERDLFMLGLGVYIGEGTKTNDIVRIINANPAVVALSIKWFKIVCGLSLSNFSIRLHLYPDNDVQEAVQFWSRVTGLPREQFQKPQIDLRRKKISKRGKLPHGTAHVTVKSNGNKNFGVILARKINAWIETTYEKAGVV